MNTIACRVCGAAAQEFARARVLGRHDVRYDRCPQCGFIQTETPYWLSEAYGEAIAASDVGLLRRNFILATVTRSVIRSFFNGRGKFLDYGGGYGALTRLLRDAGLDARRHDPICPNLFARGWDAQAGPLPDFEMLTAFEVFEHLVDPPGELDRMLAFSRNILFTTLLQPEPAPQPDRWWYYCLDTGQHVALYTRRSLQSLADRHGLHLASNGRDIHLFSARPVPPRWFSVVSRYRVARLRCPFLASTSLTEQDYRAARDAAAP